MRIALGIEYDGRPFCGWQSQPGGCGIQDALESAIGHGPHICGEQFTAADVYVGSQIGWGMMFGSIDKRAAFVDYWGRISSRPAHARAREIDDALVAEQQQAQAAAQPQTAE